MRQEKASIAPRDMTRTPGPIEEAIQDMAINGFTVAQIMRELPRAVRDVAKRQRRKDLKVPSKRTVQRIHSRTTKRDESGEWHVEDSEPRDARLILDFLAGVITETEGRVTAFTREEARWIVRLEYLALPNENLTDRLWVVRALARPDLRKLAPGIHDLITFAPWKSISAARRYIAAVDNGWAEIPGGLTLAKCIEWLLPTELPLATRESVDGHRLRRLGWKFDRYIEDEGDLPSMDEELELRELLLEILEDGEQRSRDRYEQPN